MTKNLDHRKYRLIQKIMQIEDEATLTILEQQFEEFRNQTPSAWDQAIQPIRPSISLEEMIAEQGYAPIQEAEFFQLTDDLGIEESLDDLLSQLD